MLDIKNSAIAEASAVVGEQLLQQQTLHDVRNALQRLTRSLGFTRFLYGTRVPSPAGPVDHILSDYDPAWRERYDRNGYQRVDPTLAHCLNRVTPLRWGTACGTHEQNEFMEEARAHGLHSGVSIPVRDRDGAVGMLSMSLDSGSPDALRHIRELVPQVQTMACYAHEAVHNLELALPITNRGEPSVRLSPRELQCLQWLAEGKSNWETARILGLSEHGVSFHVRNLMKKLQVSSRHVAVRRAVEMGLLRP